MLKVDTVTMEQPSTRVTETFHSIQNAPSKFLEPFDVTQPITETFEPFLSKSTENTSFSLIRVTDADPISSTTTVPNTTESGSVTYTTKQQIMSDR